MEYEPQDSRVLRIWNRLSPEARKAKLSQARERFDLLTTLNKRSKNESKRAAASRLNIKVNRTTIQRWQNRYDKLGLDGLIDIRTGPYSAVSAEIQNTICTLRRVDPNVSVETILSHLLEYHDFTTSNTTVKRILRENGLNRKRGSQKGDTTPGEVRLELGGMKLLEAACVETDYVGTLARAVSAHVKDLPCHDTAVEPDKSGRDEYGRFLPEFNERYRKNPDDPIGPGFMSVEEKRKGMNPDRLEIRNAKISTIEHKLMCLICSPMIGNGRWDGMRASSADTLLKEVCGYSYMPATLDRFARELKYAGVSNTLWEVHARLWIEQTSHWGDERRAVVIYADGTPKAIWTDLFSQSTKVGHVGRIMPGLDVVAFHTGYGVPILMITHSGRAPLVKVLPDAINKVDEICAPHLSGRIVIIDAESNSIPYLKGLENGDPSRAWINRLRAGWVENKEIFNRTAYEAYRDGDKIRMGMADFNDPDGGTFRMRVVEIERRTSGKVTFLGASTLLNTSEWTAANIADLYFERWPSQEANFRAVSQAAGFKNVHGYGKQLVDNVSVITKLDELSVKEANAQERLINQVDRMGKWERKIDEENQIIDIKVNRQETIRKEITDQLIPGETVTPSLQKIVEEQQNLTDEIDKKEKGLLKSQTRCDKVKIKISNTQARLDGYQKTKEKLEGRKKILKHDVESDSLFSLLKVGLVLLITYVLREYLGNASMDALTFLERVATLPARLRVTPTLEIVTFEYNRRDPDVMTLLEKYCEAINSRGLLTRSNRKLRIQIDPAPKPDRPPPDRERCNSNGRFIR